MQSTTAAPITIITTMVVGGILALLGSFGIYTAAQPSALTGQQAEYNYGVKWSRRPRWPLRHDHSTGTGPLRVRFLPVRFPCRPDRTRAARRPRR